MSAPKYDSVSMDDPRVKVTCAFVIIILLLCCAGAVSWAYDKFLASFVASLKRSAEERFGEAVALCGESEYLSLPAGDWEALNSLRAVLVLLPFDSDEEGTLSIHEWQKKLPKEIRAKNADTVDVVVCVERISQTIGWCTYTVVGRLGRHQFGYQLYFIDAHSRTLLGEDVIWGKMPSPCQDSIKVGSTGRVTDPYPSWDRFRLLLERHLMRSSTD